MKVLGIVCSPRKGGNTEIMMERALAGARSYGAETELWTVAGKKLGPCLGCDKCLKRGGECVQRDDMRQLYPKILAADGIIFGSPSYFLSVTAQAKIIIDRLYCLYNTDKLQNKVAGVIAVTSLMGIDGVWHCFLACFEIWHMVPTDVAIGFARDKGEIRQDLYAMKSSEELGKEVASVIKQGFHYPKEHSRNLYNICKDKYGIRPTITRSFGNSLVP